MIFFSAPIYSSEYNDRIKKYSLYFAWFIIAILLTGCSSQEDGPLTIGVASSMTSVMEELIPLFKEETGIELKASYASSGTLQNQIKAGAPLDMFISASKDKMDELEFQNSVESVRNLLKNRMVFVVYKGYSEEIKTLDNLMNTDYKIAIGEPDSVPAGRYAKEVLKSLELWDTLEKQLVFGKNVRQVADYINIAEVSSGFVYRTDLIVLKGDEATYLLPKKLHTPIIYPVGIVTESKNKEHAKVFYEFLEKESTIEIFEKYGFEYMN